MRGAARASACVLLALALLLAPLVPTSALAEEASSGPRLAEAQAAIVCDASGNVLWELNSEQEMPMASITKVMTAMLAIDSGIPMDRVVEVGEVDLPGYSQLAGFEAGTTTTFGDLLQVLLVYSANDAAVLIAREVAGSEAAFVEMMNERAAELGMDHTSFRNPHGLEEDGHHSCAADLAVMGRHAMENYEPIAELVVQESCTIQINGEQRTFESTDHLLETYPGAAGIKTGMTEFGCAFLGYCDRYGIGLYSVVLGCPTSDGRFSDTAALWDWAHDARYSHRLAEAGAVTRVLPFAYRFGLSVEAVETADVSGVYDASLGEVTRLRSASDGCGLLESGQAYGASLWLQDGRVVGLSTEAAGARPTRVPSFGRLNSWSFVDRPPVVAA